MATEWLYYVPARTVAEGTTYPFYAVATDPSDCRELRAMGGRLSDNWEAFYEQLDAENAMTL